MIECEFITSPVDFFNAPEGREREYVCRQPATGCKAGFPVCDEHGGAEPQP